MYIYVYTYVYIYIYRHDAMYYFMSYVSEFLIMQKNAWLWCVLTIWQIHMGVKPMRYQDEHQQLPTSFCMNYMPGFRPEYCTQTMTNTVLVRKIEHEIMMITVLYYDNTE